MLFDYNIKKYSREEKFLKYCNKEIKIKNKDGI